MPEVEATNKLLCSTDDATERLSIGRSQMFDLIRRGEIQSVKVGRRRLVLTASLDAYVDRLVAEQNTEGAA